VRGHRIGSERDLNERSRWLSLVVGLPGLNLGPHPFKPVTSELGVDLMVQSQTS
jgi:hypothetical protein